MNTKSEPLHTELVHIESIGFMFEVNHHLKYNLISTDVPAFIFANLSFNTLEMIG